MRIAESDGLVGADSVNPGAPFGGAPGMADLDEFLATYLELPVVAVLGVPGVGQRLLVTGIGDPLCGALNDDVLAVKIVTHGAGVALKYIKK